MKIAIATDRGRVSAHFGRCLSYTIVDVQGGNVAGREEIPNPGHTPGFLPRFLHEKGVEAIIAGGMGPQAQGLFAERNIRTIIGVGGPVDEAVGLFLRGELEPGPDLCDHGHRHEGPCRHDSPASGRDAVVVSGERVCVSAKGGGIEADLDPLFGRAPFFLFVDPSTLDFEALENPHVEVPHGAGIQAAQFVAEKRPAAILTGRVGPNAARVLESAGIRVIPTEASSVREAIARFKAG
jgi:predicted Fe-Mo cluster-binding NifX family protein